MQSFGAEQTFSTHSTWSTQQTQSCVRSLATPSPHWHLNMFPTLELDDHKSKCRSLLFSPHWAATAAAYVSSTVLCSASCRSSNGVTSVLWVKEKNGNKIVARRRWRSATAFRNHHLMRKMVLQMPRETTRLQNTQIFWKVRKTRFSRPLPSQLLFQWRHKGMSRPNWGGVATHFHDTQL